MANYMATMIDKGAPAQGNKSENPADSTVSDNIDNNNTMSETSSNTPTPTAPV